MQASVSGTITEVHAGVLPKNVAAPKDFFSRPQYRSPFRYPGGKTWLVPYTRFWLESLPFKVEELVEPFAGGAAVALTALFENRVERITLVELDPDVAAVWKTVTGPDAEWLCEQINGLTITKPNVETILHSQPETTRDRAFQTIVRNRVQRGGILFRTAGLMKLGERGRGLGSRWYPETLSRRIMDIFSRRASISFFQDDGIHALHRLSRKTRLAIFIDPPYTVAAKRLYAYSSVDHAALFSAAQALKSSFLMSYDESDGISEIAARHHFALERIAMRSAHHTEKYELLISRMLDWIPRAIPQK